MLIICFVYLVIIIPVTVYVGAVLYGWNTIDPLRLNVSQYRMCFAIRLSIVSFMYYCFDMFAGKRLACSMMV